MNRESLNRESGAKQLRQVSTFENLEVYRAAHQFPKAMYRVAKSLSDIEKFGLASQIRRAAVSLTNNIAEGHGRYHYLDQIKFTLQSRGSLEELIDDLNVCEDEQYLVAKQIIALKEQDWRGRQLLDGDIRYLRQQINSPASRMKEEELLQSADADDSRFSM
ncbi:MAG TPA: four helix bundle protein [Candidatus Udaeobacter sp.]|nr:four helix bundle protein [Candidatus Udaeobacter sp.]